MVVRARPGGSRIATPFGLRDPAAMDETTGSTETKRLVRSRDDRMVAGVCGGLARYFDINPAFYRVGFVVLTLLGGAGILIYAAAALVIPDEGRVESVASAALRNRDERPWPVIGLGLVGIALVVLVSRASLWPAADLVWVLVLAAGVAILWAQGRDTRATPEVARGRRGSRRAPARARHHCARARPAGFRGRRGRVCRPRREPRRRCRRAHVSHLGCSLAP